MNVILNGIKDAINDEVAAQKKYKELKEQATDKKVKALFKQLIEDEKNHEKILRSRFQAIKNLQEEK
jgi:rubrerythrin